MDKKLILAVAGAGKTYHICHNLNPNETNLIIAFTNENIHNIEKELCSAYGNIPETTTVMTFHSFVIRQMILPYEPTIREYFRKPNFMSQGFSVLDPPIKYDPKTNRPNPKYIEKTKFEHYITSNQQYYVQTVSELVLQINNRETQFIKRIAKRLNLFFKNIMIDEFQDFRESDYELLMQLSKHLNNVMFVGDYYQHSVSAKNNTGKPFKKRDYITCDDFIQEIRKAKFEVDTKTLQRSRRCSAEVCKFVRDKLGINILPYDDHEGRVIFINVAQVENILSDNNIVKLVWNNAHKYKFYAKNWSYSKGDTEDSACVILTKDLENIDGERFSCNKLSQITLNKLYVALTRSKGNVYVIKDSIFKTVENKYAK